MSKGETIGLIAFIIFILLFATVLVVGLNKIVNDDKQAAEESCALIAKATNSTSYKSNRSACFFIKDGEILEVKR